MVIQSSRFPNAAPNHCGTAAPSSLRLCIISFTSQRNQERESEPTSLRIRIESIGGQTSRTRQRQRNCLGVRGHNERLNDKKTNTGKHNELYLTPLEKISRSLSFMTLDECEKANDDGCTKFLQLTMHHIPVPPTAHNLHKLEASEQNFTPCQA